MTYWKWLMLFLWLVSCKGSEKLTTTYKDIPTIEQGWDIYIAGTYRYGPSIIVNADQSIDVWFAAEGDRHGKWVDFFKKDDRRTALRIAEDTDIVAQKFTIDKPFYAVSVILPTWHSKTSAITFSLYEWKKDYEKSIASKPIIQKRFENLVDNGEVKLINEQKFPVGQYIWVLSDAKGTPGVWVSNADYHVATNYINGRLYEIGSYEGSCLLDKSNGFNYWDRVMYRHSKDGGKTWTPDEVVLRPTDGGRDEYSTCDPGVVKFGEYYYLGYTSTEDIGMVDNDLYICRSKTPRGTWEKWNGKGWGGMPQPIIEFTGNKKSFGVGEPSMVVVNNKLYLYYTWNDTGEEATTTRVATAIIDSENWPAQLVHHGTAINKSAIKGADHIDIKYRTDLKKFYAMHTAARFSKEAHLMLWESVNGIQFRQVGTIATNLQPYLHNCGWGGDALGHIDPEKPAYVGYSYGQSWGSWNTFWHRLQF